MASLAKLIERSSLVNDSSIDHHLSVRNPIDQHKDHSVGHQTSIYPVANRSHDNQVHQLNTFHTYENEWKKLLTTEPDQRSFANMTADRSISSNLIIDQALERDFRRKFASKKFQAPKMCRCQLRRSARIVNGQVAEPNRCVSLFETDFFCSIFF